MQWQNQSQTTPVMRCIGRMLEVNTLYRMPVDKMVETTVRRYGRCIPSFMSDSNNMPDCFFYHFFLQCHTIVAQHGNPSWPVKLIQMRRSKPSFPVHQYLHFYSMISNRLPSNVGLERILRGIGMKVLGRLLQTTPPSQTPTGALILKGARCGAEGHY